jgi:hypothetical protein
MSLTLTTRGHGGRRLKPPLVLPPLVVPDGVELDEFACPVSVAADLTETSFQNLHQQIDRGELPAYIGPGGVKMIRLDDLTESPAARRQARKQAQVNMRRAQHAINRDKPISSESPEDRCVGTWEDCRICGPITLVYEAEGDQLIDVPQPVKRPVSAAKLASLERARAAKVLADARLRLERERDIAEMKARIEGEGHGPAA